MHAQALLAARVDRSVNATCGTIHGFDLLAAGRDISRAAIERVSECCASASNRSD